MATRSSVETKVAIVGTGSAGMKYLEALCRMETMQPIAIPKRPHRLHELREAGYATARDLEEAIQQGATLGIIASDTGWHLEDGLAALGAGLHVLVEKPLGVDGKQALRLCEQASKSGGVLHVGCVLRFSDSLNTFREALKEIGSLHAVRIECQSYLPQWRPLRPYRDSYSARREEGGVLRDLVHEIDYAAWLYGWPAALQGRIKNLGRLKIEAEEIAEVTWETKTGCVVSLYLDYLSRPSRRRMRACGERGTIEWDGTGNKVTLTVDGAAVKQIRSLQGREEMLRDQIRAFIDSSNGRSDSRLATGEEGARALAVCDAARRAAVSRREEQVRYA